MSWIIMGLLFRSLYKYRGAQILCERLILFSQHLRYEIADIGQGNKLEMLVPESQASHSDDKNQDETPQCFHICRLLQSF